MKAEFRAWWVPQIPMPAFIYPVPDIQAGKMLCDALAEYDIFQFENKVKPDYCNAGGLSWRHPVHTQGEWEDFDPEDEDEVAEIMSLVQHDQAA